MRLLHLQPEPPPAQNLSRVRSKLAPTILAFWASRIGSEFHNEELRAYVMARHPDDCAPDSPRRIMKQLHAEGLLNAPLIDRRSSLYQALPLEEQMPIQLRKRDLLAELRRELTAAQRELELAHARIRALEART